MEKFVFNWIYFLDGDFVFFDVWVNYVLIMEGLSFDNVVGLVWFRMNYSLFNSI